MKRTMLKHALTSDAVRLNLAAETKVDAIRELVGILADSGLVTDRVDAENVVLERERVMSTGMEHGIAIPHGKTDAVGQLVAAVALKPQGLDFDCADGGPARILVITLSPLSKPGPHLRFMAEVTRLLRQESVRDRLFAAGSPAEVIDILLA